MKSSFYKYTAVAAITASTIAYVAVAPTDAATPFTDIPANSPHLKAIDALYNEKIITGRTATTYAPSAAATRAETAFFIANAIGIDTVNVKNPGFVDVKTNHKYYGAIAALYNAGVISGSKNAAGQLVFTPDGPVKRAHMGKMLTIGFELDEASQSTTKFADVNKINNVETRKQIQTLVNYGITQGTSATTFDPYKDVTRAQLATFLYRTLEVVEDEELSIIIVE